MSLFQGLADTGMARGAIDVADRGYMQDRASALSLSQAERADKRDVMLDDILLSAAKVMAAEQAAKKKPAVAAKPAIDLPRTLPMQPGQMSPDDMMLLRGADTGGFAMADGGEVPSHRYSGGFDMSKVKDGRLPRIYREYLNDLKTPGFKHGGQIGDVVKMIGDACVGCRAMRDGGAVGLADGGEVANGIGTPMGFKDGGEFSYENLWEMVQSHLRKPQEMQGGGPVRGPGTGTSDSVPAVGPGGQPFALSNGEYVLSADTVRAVGKDKLDALQAKHHKKVG